ncbi:expressed tetratricopeptide repeat protein [Nitzschia inconspicua]|uniref:Expressed tetratricopeptide repeat protein n=1 Tax=Nitzschia inconspicua TaxID=303405 RepID=A0A9K3Q2V5_9STRA|nr:expressed tetratricopeptide repeat protein [Nitzschia inconspicua]
MVTSVATRFMPSKSLPRKKLDECRQLYLQGKSEHAKMNFVDAGRLFSKAVYMQEMLLGKYHQDTVKTYWRLGRAACLAKQERQAIEAFHRAMRMAETTFEESVIKSLLHDVEAVWGKAKELETGDENRCPTADRALESPMQDFERLLSLEKNADLACKNQEFISAIRSYEEALELLAKVAGCSDTLCGADIRVKQSTCYLKNHQQAEAAETLSTAYECYLRRLGGNHPATLGAAATLKTLRKNSFLNNEGGKWWTASLSSLGSNASPRSTSCENDDNF